MKIVAIPQRLLATMTYQEYKAEAKRLGEGCKDNSDNSIALLSDKKEWAVEGVIDEYMGQYLVQRRPTWVDKKDVHADKKVRQFLARRGRLYRR